MPELKRHEVRKILKREPGALAGLAKTLGKTTAAITLTLQGKSTSAHIMAAATGLAKELLAKNSAA